MPEMAKTVTPPRLPSIYKERILIHPQAGIASTHTQLLLNGIYPVLCWIGAVAGARATDRIGRRPLLLWSILFSAACFAIITGTTKIGPENKTAANVAITFIYLFGIIFSFGWTPLQSMYIAETL